MLLFLEGNLSISSERIRELCDGWCAASTTNGGLVVNNETEAFRLWVNGIVFHELSHEQACVALVSLAKVLLRPGMNTVIHFDHYGIWSWCGQLLLNSQPPVFDPVQHEIDSLFKVNMHAMLADCNRPNLSPEDYAAQMDAERKMPHHARNLIGKASLISAYLAFPLLEAMLKRACAAFVGLDGGVISSFQVLKSNGRVKQYDPGRQCSSIGDLLNLHYHRVASVALKSLIDEFRSHVLFLEPSSDPFDSIYRWRNDSLHGTANYSTIGGAVMSLVLLISMFEIEADYEARRLKEIDRLKWVGDSVFSGAWDFYPPF